MASPQNFRSSFNGFNREDVVNYISYMSNKHEMELNQLRQEADSMRQELEQLRGMGDEAQLQQENQSLRRQLEELQQEKEELMRKNEALRHKFTQLLETRKAEQEQEQEQEQQEQLPPAEPQPTVQDRSPEEPVRADPYDCTEELNAYRRAESTERRARERAARMYEQANGILADASKGLEQSGGNLLELSRQVQLDLEEFQQAIAASGQILSDTMTALAAVRPDEEA